MKFASLFTSVALVATMVAAQNTLTINTPVPNPVVCQPTLITWTGGTPPYIVSLFDGNSFATTLEELGTFPTGTSFTWTANYAPGTKVGMRVLDATGIKGETAPFDIASGSNTACVGQAASVAPGATGAAPAGSAPAASGSTPAASASGSAPAASGSRPASASGGANAAQTSAASNAGVMNGVNVGLAGLVGAAVVAIVA